MSVAEMRELEEATFRSGVAEASLQERAGAAVTRSVLDAHPEAGSAVALVGTGNNGRDAWIAVAGLLRSGWSGELYLVPHHAITDAELSEFLDAGGRLITHRDGTTASDVSTALQGHDVIVDGLLGIGARGEPREPLRTIIGGANAARRASSRLITVAVDNPSGVDADSGESAETCILADLTVVLGAAKQGLLTPRAANRTGRLMLADIGVVDGPPGAPSLVTRESVAGLVPIAAPDAHKGLFGRLLVVAGSPRYAGAAILTCAAAVRAGAGVVALACPRWLRDIVATRVPEVTYLPLPDDGPSGAPDACARRIAAELDSFQAMAIGPGLSTDSGVPDFVESVLRERARRKVASVLDADALNALATRPQWPGWIGAGVVLTPHLGELRRLTMREDVTNLDRPWETAGRLATEWRSTLVVKGPFTAIGSDGLRWVLAAPNPALATAGTGDVLTGIIGGLLARGQTPAAAACLGVWVHANAGARAALGKRLGGMAASDLLSEIPAALAETASS